MNNKLHLITASIIALGSSCSLMAQTDTVYRYSFANGINNATFNYTNGFTISPGPNAPNEMNGANWATLINSGRVLGTGHSTAVRAFDWTEDNQVNYLTTGATDGAAVWYFSNNANTNAQSGTPGGTTFVNGVFDGESILGNPNIIAIYDDQVILFNPEAASGSTALSLYSVNTRQETLGNFGFNTFSGGSLNGLTLESQMNRLIGAEDGYLWYLEDDGSAIAYGLLSGAAVLDPTWTTFSGGLMDGISLSNALDSGHYLGIGAGPDFYFVASVIPEPTTYALFLAAGALLVAKTRRNKAQGDLPG